MGQAWYCRKCEEAKIKMSNACAERFINEETGGLYTPEERSMNKHHCIDDRHSKQHGLTIENFENLAESVENQIKKASKLTDLPCPKREAVIECLKEHPDCMSKCFEEMNEFISCVDAARINIIKQKIDRARKEYHQQKLRGMFNVE